MKTNYDKPYQELAEEFIRKFQSIIFEYNHYAKNTDGVATVMAIYHVEGLLEVCPEYVCGDPDKGESYREPNPIYPKLTECLTILKSKG